MVNITARGFKLREEIKTKVDAELKRITKMLPSNAEFDVTITHKNDVFKCDITVRHIGAFVRGEAVAKEVLPSVDLAVDNLKRQLRKLKTKLKDKREFANYDAFVDNVEEDEDFEEVSSTIDRVKNVELHSMKDDEAVLQMEMLGHSFFVYLDENGQTSLVYKRNEGENSYGKLIFDK